ncbi:MAG: hypothetical protein P9E24_06225 [Candidatus Competibacter sp.]|nr:hypothetical protein [Candidatus Competibacter sp.]MDG4585150.1 hypothetical protein [Candidatus Competibacter sp.]
MGTLLAAGGESQPTEAEWLSEKTNANKKRATSEGESDRGDINRTHRSAVFIEHFLFAGRGGGAGSLRYEIHVWNTTIGLDTVF